MFARKPFSEAATVYLEERKPHVSERTIQFEKERLKPLCKHFGQSPQITPEIEHFISSLDSPSVGLRHGIKEQTIAVAEVVLRDFDGTKTIYPAKMPLSELISNDETDEGMLVTRHYAKTDQRDEHGRTVYVERN